MTTTYLKEGVIIRYYKGGAPCSSLWSRGVAPCSCITFYLKGMQYRCSTGVALVEGVSTSAAPMIGAGVGAAIGGAIVGAAP